jgi:hypothetical protein
MCPDHNMKYVIFTCRTIPVKKIVIDLQFKAKLQETVTALIHSRSLNGNVLKGGSATAQGRKLSSVNLQRYSFLKECSRVDLVFEFTRDTTKIRLKIGKRSLTKFLIISHENNWWSHENLLVSACGHCGRTWE